MNENRSSRIAGTRRAPADPMATPATAAGLVAGVFLLPAGFGFAVFYPGRRSVGCG